jgi:endo-1,4-beta-mannosidase
MIALVVFSTTLSLGATNSVRDLYSAEQMANPGTNKPPTTLGVQGTAFTLNGKPTFLLGISYYGALGAPEETIRCDLAEMKRHGLNWIRVWATWAAFGSDVSAVDGEGRPRPAFLKKLDWLVAECDRQGLVVDVTLSRGNGTSGPSRLQTMAAHRRAVETLTNSLKTNRNWYLDLANERNIKDQRFTSFADLKELRAAVRSLDPKRLVTASHAGDIGVKDLRNYLLEVGVDFLAPHRPRHSRSPQQTEKQSRAYLSVLKDLGHSVPVHYQEPFRRGYGTWQPRAEDYLTDLQGAQAGGAAGWCFHNGDQRGQPESRPRRSFDLRNQRLFDQLDREEMSTFHRIHSLKKTNSGQ